jgi:peptidoglycan/LPS O-acetylase OafA/YrhL
MINKIENQSNFRFDINGLRAWAVMAVTLYHFGVPGFNGGFIGVDVFFVISGFLMTSIVVSGLERSAGFSILAFYMARARRIFPALMALCVVLLVLGAGCLTYVDYKPLSKQIITSLTFLSNIAFWREAGYFDSAGHEKWLLHTWSLSVEWQFYLLLPLLLQASWKLFPGRKLITLILTLGFFFSLFFSIFITPLEPTAAFYLLPTRAWEMLAGGLVYLLAHQINLCKRHQVVMEIFGFGFIIAGIIWFDSLTPWPGCYALVPVFGAGLLLIAARQQSFLSGNFLVQWLGTRSYSIYLWHWPIVVALVFVELKESPIWISIGLLLTLVLGHFSFVWIETRFRKESDKFHFGLRVPALCLVSLLILVLSIGIYLSNGVPGRFSPVVELMASEQNNINPRKDRCLSHDKIDSPSCVYGGNHLSAVLIGDSHADAVVTALAAAIPDPNNGIMEWTYTACPTIRGVMPVNGLGVCGGFVDWVIKNSETIAKEVPLVIVNRTTYFAIGNNNKLESSVNKPRVYFNQLYVSATPEFLNEFSERLVDTACLLAKNHLVYLMRPLPEMNVEVPKVMARNMMMGNKDVDISISLDEYHRRHDFIWEAQNVARDRCGVKILDPLPYLCSKGRCNASRDGRPLYFDDNHLSEFGNKLLVPMFEEVFK